MSDLNDFKISSFKKPVSKLPDAPSMPASELKEYFDSNSNELKASFNGLIDALEGENSLNDFKLNGKTAEELLEEKADKEEVSDIKNTLEEKADKNEVNDVKELVNTKADADELNDVKEYLEEKANKTDVDNKVDKEEGKGLSSNDFTDEDKESVALTKEEVERLSNYGDANIIPSDESWFVFEEIDDGAFLVRLSEECPDDITEIVVPYEYNGLPVVDISSYPFSKITDSLTKIILPDSLEGLDWSTFGNATKLVEVRLPKYIKRMSFYCFQNCTSIKSIDIPKGVTNLEESCFDGCSNLENLILPSGVNTIRAKAFKGCKNLRLHIPDSVTEIKTDGLEDLKAIVISPNNDFLKEVLKDYNLYFDYVSANELASYVKNTDIEYAVKSVGDGYYATTEQIGDISTAFDELHTYAQAIITGDYAIEDGGEV